MTPVFYYRRTVRSQTGEWSLSLNGDFILAFLVAWPVMVALGVLHHDWTPTIPALGYLPTVALVFAVWAVHSLLTIGKE